KDIRSYAMNSIIERKAGTAWGSNVETPEFVRDVMITRNPSAVILLPEGIDGLFGSARFTDWGTGTRSTRFSVYPYHNATPNFLFVDAHVTGMKYELYYKDTSYWDRE
ncbi:MAG: hypothetical protein WCS27_17815, partial [Victivallaceae bacterium]